MVPNATMWRKEYLYAYGGWSALPVGDDYGVLFAVADRHPTAYVDEVVMHWRHYPEQTSADPARQALGTSSARSSSSALTGCAASAARSG